MRILQVGTGFLPVLPTVTGGAEKYVYYLSATLDGMGHEVTIIDREHYPRPVTPFSVVPVSMRWRYDSNILAHAVRGLLFGRAAAKRIDSLLQEESFDVVNFHSQFSAVMGIPVASRHGVPAVFTNHNPLWCDDVPCRSRLERAKFWMERRAQARADAVICVSDSVAGNLARYFSVERSRLWSIPVGIAPHWFEDRPVAHSIRAKYSPNGEPVVLHVGRIAPYKNQITLVRSWSLVRQAAPDARLVFVGPVDSPAYQAKLRAVLNGGGADGRVIFAGRVPLDELSQLYALARVFVLPSLRESCPQAALETMAQACPIVGSDIGPMRELLSAGAGLTVPATDHHALARAITSVLSDGGLRNCLGSQARRRVYEGYRWDVVARRVADRYAGLSDTALLHGAPSC